MNILFLTLLQIESLEKHSIYHDLFRKFRDHGHYIYIVSPRERRNEKKTELITEINVQMLCVKIGNITKCNVLEKGISTMLIEKRFKSAIKRYFLM